MSIIRFGHLSDPHFICDRSKPGGNMRKYLDAGGDPEASLRTALTELAGESPDFIIVTGDLCHEGTEEDYAALRDIFDELVPGVPVLAALGNHDVRDAFRKGFLHDNYGGAHPYCDSMDVKGLRILSVDSAFDKGLIGSVDDKQLDWLEDELSEGAERGSILIFHHPVCAELTHVGMELSPRLERIIRGSDIRALFNGHVHRSCIGHAAGVLHVTAQALSFDIDAQPGRFDYTTRSGYNMCTLDHGGFFVESRITTPKGAVFTHKLIEDWK